MRYIGNRAISKLSEAIDYFGYITNYELYGGMAWAIESTDKDIGIIGGIQIFKHNNRNFIAYYLDPSYQKKGIMTNSLKLVIEYYHKNISNDALYANVHIKNTRSESLLRKLGFILNGKLQLENTFSLKSNNNE
jgi:ribosomal-protein-alanine N-acetyltransferase